jgi:hypothetical protein
VRLVLAVLCAAIICGMASLASPGAAARPAQASPPPPVQQQQQRAVDDNDDTRVEVQLVVLAVAAGVVGVAGTAAYLLRRSLGLTRYNPDEHRATSHH